MIEVSKVYLPTLSTAFSDPRLQLIIADAAAYVRDCKQLFDVIICDSSDPVGPADVLFQPAFFQSLRDVLNPSGGVLCTQGECIYLHLELIANVLGNLRGMFASVRYAYTTIPSYPSGQIGFMVATRDEAVDVTQSRGPGDLSSRYYSQDIHRAAFVLPSKSSSLCASDAAAVGRAK